MSHRDDPAPDIDRHRGDAAPTILVCNNGHILEATLASATDLPRDCPLCAALLIAACPGCREPILGVPVPARGSSADDFRSGPVPFAAPRYCHCCGRPFPWTERVVSAVRAAIRQIGALDAHERDQLRRSIDHIIHETPQTRLAVLRINAVLSRIGGESASALRELILSIAGDGVKQHLVQANPLP